MKRAWTTNGVAVAFLLGSAAVLAARTAPPASAATKVDRSRFSGKWTLNAEQSENLREKMRQARGGEGRGGPGGGGGFPREGGRRGGGPRGGAGGRGATGGGEGGPREGVREGMRRLEEPSAVLTIKQEDGEFMVGDDRGEIRHLYPDGRASKTDEGATEVRARWEGDQLTAETIPSRGPRTKETFALSPSGRQLFVTLHLEPRWGGAVDVRRVYDAAGEP